MRSKLWLAACALALASIPARAGVDVLQPVGGPLVKTPELENGEVVLVPIEIHFGTSKNHWAGIKFPVNWDPTEATFLGLLPAPGFLATTSGGSGSFSLPTLWSTNATNSGFFAFTSSAITLGTVNFLAMGEYTPLNSDIDVTFGQSHVIPSPFNIFHVTGSGGQLVQVSTLLYVPKTNPTLSAWGVVAPGAGTWIHVTQTTVLSAVQSAFYGVKSSIATPGGVGIEHIPEPASAVLLGSGMALLALARRRQARTRARGSGRGLSTAAALPTLLVCGLLALSFATRAGAHQEHAEFDLDQLTRNADEIVEGEVEAVSARWNAANTQIHTTVRLRVNRYHKGGRGQPHIEVVLLGGTVGDQTLAVLGQPTFAVGQQVLLFLRPRWEALDLPLVGMEHGAFRIDPNTDQVLDSAGRGRGRPDVIDEIQAINAGRRGPP